MEGKLDVNHERYNKITAIWSFKEYRNVPLCSHASPPFLLMTDGHSILFSMETCYENERLNLKLRQGTSRTIRAIVTISLKRDSRMEALKSSLHEYWEAEVVKKVAQLPAHPFDSNLTITCSVTWLGFNNVRVTGKHPTPPLYKIRTHFDPDVIPDVKIIIGTEELSAHKGLLALHSPVMLAMFETPMKESIENRVIVEDIEFQTMEILLKIISTGETQDLDDFNVALKVLEAAEKYQMLMIKEACECKLALKVGHYDIISLLENADQYNAQGLIETCVEYIIARKQSMTCEKFQDMCLNKPNVAAAVLKTQMSKLYSIPES